VDTAVWILLCGYLCVDTSVWTLLCGYCCVDTAVWILLFGHCCVDTSVWTLLCGYFCVDAAVWTLLCGYFCFDTAVWTLLCGHCSVPHYLIFKISAFFSPIAFIPIVDYSLKRPTISLNNVNLFVFVTEMHLFPALFKI
jgi:hypothetical protein